MEDGIEKIIDELKTAVDQNGPDYLTQEPYKVYERLKNSKNVSKKTSGLILYALVNDVQSEAAPDIDPELLSQKIQTGCSLNKKAADLLSAIFLGLYSREKEESWTEKNMEGFKRFLEDDYYQPVCEDFDIDYYVSQWCKKHGVDLVSCNGGGGDGGYEPKYRKGWY